MKNSYAALTAAQVAAMTAAFAQNFNAEQLKSFLIALDGYVASGGLPATLTTRGNVLQAAARANITPAADGTAVGTAFNDLLTKLRTAGILAP